MKKLLIIILFFNSFTSISQEKTYLDFINNMTPTFPGCENAKDKSECYQTKIGNLILSQINKENSIKSIDISKIEIELSIRTESTGKSTILHVKTNDTLIKRLVNLALGKMPEVKASYSEAKKEYTSSTQIFLLQIQKNKEENLFKLDIPKSKTDLSLKPFPILELTKNIGFHNCENVEMENFTKCFNEQFKIWLENNVENRSKNSLKGQRGTLKLRFDRAGVLTPIIISNSNEFKSVLMEVLKTFPKVKPAESNGEKINISYSIPILF